MFANTAARQLEDGIVKTDTRRMRTTGIFARDKTLLTYANPPENCRSCEDQITTRGAPHSAIGKQGTDLTTGMATKLQGLDRNRLERYNSLP